MIKYYCNIKFNVLKILKIKIFIIFFILFFSTNLNARTVGNYIGIDLIKTNLSFSTEKFMHPANQNTRPIQKSVQTNASSSYSFGLKYSYALNYRGFFIAPGLIYEKNKDAKIAQFETTLMVTKDGPILFKEYTDVDKYLILDL